MANNVYKLASKIMSVSKCAALTGAGVSTLSGLPDFRGADGLYRDKEFASVFDLNKFHEDPSIFYDRAGSLIYPAKEIIPSIVHKTLAWMENKGVLTTVITQNIDMLHHKAGSRKVLELHGSPKSHTCSNCGTQYSYEDVHPYGVRGSVFICGKCGLPVKPDITFFGELLPQGVFDEAIQVISKCDLLLVLGTSLTVTPASLLPLEAIRDGAEIVIINQGETEYDRFAALKFTDLEDTFTKLAIILHEEMG